MRACAAENPFLSRKTPTRPVEIARKKRVSVKSVVVVRRTGAGVEWTEGRDIDYQQAIEAGKTRLSRLQK